MTIIYYVFTIFVFFFLNSVNSFYLTNKKNSNDNKNNISNKLVPT